MFKVGGFEYNAVNFEYLSLAGAKAQIKGNGKIVGGQSGISFIMTVLDGDVQGGADKIRMKIYSKNTGQVYYDNQPGASDAADPVLTVGINSVIVEQGVSGKTSARITSTGEAAQEESKLSVVAMPNPSQDIFTLYVTGDNDTEKISVSLFDLHGRRIETHYTTSGSYIRFGDNYRSGSYIVRVHQGTKTKQIKLIKLR